MLENFLSEFFLKENLNTESLVNGKNFIQKFQK